MNTTLDFVLEGHIYLEERDEQGNLLSKIEMPGQAFLQAAITVLEKQIELKHELDKELQEQEQSHPFQFTYG